MKQLLLVTAISFSSLAYADNGFYTSLKAGISDTKFDNSKDQIISTEPGMEEQITLHNKDTDKSIYPNISAAVGFDFSKISNINARAELEYSYKDKAKFNPAIEAIQDIDGSEAVNEESPFVKELKSQSLMLNGYYDFKNTSKFTPYVSAGVGVTRVKNATQAFFEPENMTDTDNSFTWAAGLGVAYKVTENVALDLGYRYVDAGEVEFNNYPIEGINFKTTADLVSHDYSLGIRYNF